MVKCFKDGNRLTVVFYECDTKTQDLLIEMVKAANEKTPEEIVVPEVIPAKTVAKNGFSVVDMEKIRKVEYNKSLKLPEIMPYSGMTVSQALKKNGVNALIQLDSYLNLLDKKKDKLLLNTIQVEFKEFAESEYKNLVDKIETVDINYMRNYIINIEPVLQETIDEILQKTTYQSVDLFVISATEYELRSAFATLVKALALKY